MPDPVAPRAKRPFRFWSFFFSTQGRVSPVPYALFVPLTHGGLYAASLAISYIINRTDYMARAMAGGATGLCALLLLWPHFAVASKRLQDLALPAWPACLLFVPFIAGLGFLAFNLAPLYGAFPPKQELLQIMKYYNLANLVFRISILIALCILALIPGTRGANRYGPSPLNPDQAASDVF